MKKTEQYVNRFKAVKNRVIISAVLLLVLMFLTHPNWLFFLPAETRADMTASLDKMFGEAASVTKIAKISPIMLTQLATMLLVVILISSVLKYILHAIKTKSKKVKTVLSVLSSALTYITVITALLWGLSILGVSSGALFAGVSVIALVVGFGCESLIADIITGIFIIFDSEYTVGDIIEINGFRGTVTDIGIRTTRVTDVGGNTKIINNSDVRDVLNRSNDLSKAVCDVSVSYSESLERVEKAVAEIIDEVYAANEGLFTERPKYVGVQELGSSSVVVRIVGTVKENEIFNGQRALNRAFKLGFDKRGIEIPFTQIVIHKPDENR